MCREVVYINKNQAGNLNTGPGIIAPKFTRLTFTIMIINHTFLCFHPS